MAIEEKHELAEIFDPEESTTAIPLAGRPIVKSLSDRAVVIIVDDEPSITQLYSLILRRAGFKVEKTFFNGFDVVEYFRKNSTGIEHNITIIVIMDQMMPRMNGLTAAMKLRQLKEDLKIVAASAFSLSPQEVRLFDRILMKPFSSEELVDAVRSLVVENKNASVLERS
jgi:two-component system OmpR family response regulator